MTKRDFTINLKLNDLPEKMAHLTSRDFFDYFAVKYLQTKHKLCAIPYWLNWKVQNSKKQDLEVPEFYLNQCMESSERFVSIPLCLSSEIGGAHANALFIDKKEKTAERYEPHGARSYQIFDDFEYEKFDKNLGSYLKKKYGLEYIPPSNFLPALGPQSFEHYIDESGYCATWSLWYIDMRLSYPNISREKLVLGMFDKVHDMLRDPAILTRYLVNYAKQVYNVMVSEFPQYKDFFINYDVYKKLPKNNKKKKAFDAFVDEMNDLVENPLHINKPVVIHAVLKPGFPGSKGKSKGKLPLMIYEKPKKGAKGKFLGDEKKVARRVKKVVKVEKKKTPIKRK